MNSLELTQNGLLKNPDVVLIGGGIMSATLGVMLKKLNPELTIQIVEGLSSVALESSHAWNNAGTGHAALCELNYTALNSKGEIEIGKATNINEQFEQSKQFWSYLTANGVIKTPSDFIRKVPHMSFVRGEENVEFLSKRFEGMKQHHFFQDMEFSTDPAKIAEWVPLLGEGRDSSEKIAVTRVENGTDIDFGSLTEVLFSHLKSQPGVYLATETTVKNLSEKKDGSWVVKIKKEGACCSEKMNTPFVFIGAGGGALKLLQKSGIKEGKGFGGFPVSGQFLVCKNEDIVKKHGAKVYGKAAVGAPPMSVPHLDTRVIDGEKSLLFGPYAGFSPKFLKSGSILDLASSISLDNIKPMICAGLANMSLTRYLYGEVRSSHNDRMDILREFYPDAKNDEWELATAGQRVQIIKKDKENGGKLQFGTEVVSSENGSLAALLGASPGASTSVAVILEVLRNCFPEEMKSPQWKETLSAMVQTHDQSLADNKDLYATIYPKVNQTLGI